MLNLPDPPLTSRLASLETSYEFCRQVTAKYSKTFYWGSALMPVAKRRAIWAIYVWCRRTDELVDGPQSEQTTPETLDRWERNLESIFAGTPLADPDVALVEAVQRFNLDIQPFRDMITGQRMDLYRSRYSTYEELELYCYRVAGTVGLMTAPVLGTAEDLIAAPWDSFLHLQRSPDRNPYDPTEQAIALGVANQLTNILRDVGEDRHRGRIYLPLEDLDYFGYSERDLMNGVINDRWRDLMRFQIQRARDIFQRASSGIRLLGADARWPVWAALVLYSRILNVIERNGYDVFNKRAYVPTAGKVRCLPVALMRSLVL